MVHDVNRHPCELVEKVAAMDVLLTAHGFQVKQVGSEAFVLGTFCNVLVKLGTLGTRVHPNEVLPYAHQHYNGLRNPRALSLQCVRLVLRLYYARARFPSMTRFRGFRPTNGQTWACATKFTMYCFDSERLSHPL